MSQRPSIPARPRPSLAHSPRDSPHSPPGAPLIADLDGDRFARRRAVRAVVLFAIVGFGLDWFQWGYDPPEIARIEWSWWSLVPCERTPTFRIDLIVREVWVGYPDCHGGAPEPPPGARVVNGFWRTKTLSDAEVATFQQKVRSVGLNRWSSSYRSWWFVAESGIPRWSVTVTYMNGSSMASRGSGAVPHTWEQMSDLVWELTE